MAKILSKEDRAYLLSLKKEDLTVSKITSLFSKTAKKEDGKMVISQPRFDVRSKLALKKGEYINETDVPDTTVGSFLFNKIMVEGTVEDIVPNHYFNDVINEKGFGKFLKLISEGVMQEKIPVDPNLTRWLKDYEFYSMKLSTIFSPSYTEGLLKHNTEVVKEREKILKSNKEGKTDIKTLVDMEDKIVAKARKELKNDPGMTLFDSGARGSFENDYKNMNLSLGAVAKPGKDGEFYFVESNYIDGLQKKDMVSSGNVVVNAAFPKAIDLSEHLKIIFK